MCTDGNIKSNATYSQSHGQKNVTATATPTATVTNPLPTKERNPTKKKMFPFRHCPNVAFIPSHPMEIFSISDFCMTRLT